MELFDKINDFAKTATEKTNNAIEIAKISSRIEAEQSKLNDIVKKMGEHYIRKIDSGEVLDDEAMAIYEGVAAGRKAIMEMRAEIESLKASKAAEKQNPAANTSKFCPFCGKELDASVKFCLNCGKQQP